jgi:hypothetical protein
MKQEWTKFQAKVQSEIYPILSQMGYKLQEAGNYEDNGGYLLIYEKDSENRIFIDVIEGMAVEAGTIKDFNVVRVELSKGYLKTLIGKASDTNMYLRDGWIWTNEDELDQCIEEIVNGLKIYFDTHAE